MSSPDLEALVTPKIAEAIQAAVNKVGRSEFETMAGIDEGFLAAILTGTDQYVSVAFVTLACKINKSHNDPDPTHSSVTECLKGTTIRMPGEERPAPPSALPLPQRRRIQKLFAQPSTRGATNYGKPFRLLTYSANTITFLILGYFIGGLALSILLGYEPCIGVTATPPSLSPCAGSILGIILGAVLWLGYTYYYFVKKV